MRILAVNTATPACGVAVVDEGTVSAHAVINSGETHARQLLPLIDRTLNSCRLTVADLDGFAAVRGPGSFTGLRIGISTIKGLAAAGGKPVTSVSSLEALAYPFSGCVFPVCALIDARKGQVYACWYRFRDNALEPLTGEVVIPPEEAAARFSGPCLFVGTGAGVYRSVIESIAGSEARFALPFQNDIRPETVAHLGLRRLRDNDTESLDGFTPVYVRPPDAIVSPPAVLRDNG
ncbi:MAG: tRNA (adenosine(37)-N6)-threonylcarbamoyltransferase complex dimerization subunit type 1 TsaB [Thermodesulfobacteriota bacterium]